ncbi:MAG: phospho-sugar mutase [Mycoplasma sp.]
MVNKIYQEWLTAKGVCNHAKALMKKMDQKQIDSYFSNESLKFGTAGIRGTMGPGTHQMNCYTYQQFTSGFAQYLLKKYPKNPSVIIGHDNRLKSDQFAIVCANVLTSYGIKVYLFKNNELIPTPIISYAIRMLNASGGIIVTASHNPKEYNGFKVYNPDGGQIINETAKAIEELMPSCVGLTKLKFKPNNKLIRYFDQSMIDSYFFSAKKVFINRDILDLKKTYPVVYTTHHGTASKYLGEFLKSCHFNPVAVTQQCYPDGNFPNSPIANPEDPKSFELAIKKANQVKADVIVAVDPDADRMALMVKHQKQWRLMTGNEMGMIYVYYTLKNKSFMHQPFIVSSHVSTNYIDLIAKKYGAKVFRSLTGFKQMGKIVTENDGPMDFIVAFEEAIGALNTNINRDKDSFTASALALEIYHYCKSNKMTIVDYLHHVIFKEFGNWFGKTDSFIIPGLDWKAKANQLMKSFKNFKKTKIGDFKIQKINWNKDGDCLEWHLGNNSWIKFRKSGTEPKFKAYYNFYEKSLKELENKYLKVHKIFKEFINS